MTIRWLIYTATPSPTALPSGHKQDKLERLRRFITRPAVFEKRLSLTAHGKVS